MHEEIGEQNSLGVMKVAVFPAGVSAPEEAILRIPYVDPAGPGFSLALLGRKLSMVVLMGWSTHLLVGEQATDQTFGSADRLLTSLGTCVM